MQSALYNECYEIWSGSPAVETISLGLETSTVNEKNEDRFFSDTEDSSSRLQGSQTRISYEEDDVDVGDSLVEPIKTNMKRKNRSINGITGRKASCKMYQKSFCPGGINVIGKRRVIHDKRKS